MSEEIYIADLECPCCDSETYTEGWDIAVDPDRIRVTFVKCESCGEEFGVRTKLSVEVLKTDEKGGD